MSNKQTWVFWLCGACLFLGLAIEGVWASVEYRMASGPIVYQEVRGQYVGGFYRGAQKRDPASVAAQVRETLDESVKPLRPNLYVFEAALDQEPRLRAAGRLFDYVYPVYRQATQGKRIFPRPEVIVKLQAGVDAEAFAEKHGLTFLRPVRFVPQQYLFQLPGRRNPFAVSNRLWQDEAVVWSNVNAVREVSRRFRPNDEFYPMQWHLRNTGDVGVEGADINAEAAWDLVQPDEDLVIAVIDGSTDIEHPDLNIYTNEAEANGTAGVDDDGNGLVDDVHGWDFIEDDPNQAPEPIEDHGTPVAGVAAAIGNNEIGVTGAAYGVRILPLALIGGMEDDFDETQGILAAVEAFGYAAQYADLINNSWGGPEMADAEADAIAFAASAEGKRGARGIPILFASGNAADDALVYRVEERIAVEPGVYEVRLVYEKDGANDDGQDRIFLHEIGYAVSAEENGLTFPFSGMVENGFFSHEVEVEPGPHQLVVEFAKDEAGSLADEYVDIFDLTILFDSTFAEMASIFDEDFMLSENVSLEGDAPFVFLEDSFFVSTDIMEDGQTARLVFDFEVPAETEFALIEMQFAANTEPDSDFLRLFLDGEEITGTFSGPPMMVDVLYDYVMGFDESALTLGGDLPFVIETVPDAFLGEVEVLASGLIGANQTSEAAFEVAVEEAGTLDLSVVFSGETEAGADFFRIFVDGEELTGSYDDGRFSLPFSGRGPENPNPMTAYNLHPDVINIGASTEEDVRSSYSQWGPGMGFVAPSDGGALGITTTVTLQIDAEGAGYTLLSEGYISNFGGTSSACPLASGVFAMMMSAYPDASVDTLIEIAAETSAKIGERPYDENGYNEEYGYGRLDMGAAVQRALERNDQTEVEHWAVY